MAEDNQKYEMIPVGELELDLENPRLPHNIERNEDSIIAYLASETSLEDLMSSIVSNGFFQGEPLVAYPSATDGKKYVVVEGNRRLTAVKLIHDPTLYPKASKRIIELAERAKIKPERLPVIIMEHREQVLPYLGFRHITGIKSWSPLQKARYVEQLLDATDASLSPQDRYREIANTIGSKPHTVRRLLDALAIFNMSEDNEFFGIDDLNERTLSFGVLYTALADEELQKFTGISDGNEFTHPIINSKSLNKDNVSELLTWMYSKNEKGKTVLGESRNISKLAKIVACDKALSRLRDGALLEVAYILTEGHLEEITSDLNEAYNMLSHAASIVANVPYDEGLLGLAREIKEQINFIGKTIKSKAEEDEGF